MRSPRTLALAKAFKSGKLPEPARLPKGSIDQQEAALAKAVATGDESSTASLYAAILAAGYGVRDIDLLGAFRPTWRSDGARVSYRSGMCTLNSVPVNPTPGEYVFNPLFAGQNPLGTCTWDWGPTAATANQLIYTENDSSGDSNVFRIAEGGKHPGEKLTQYSNIAYQLLFDLHWLPDASGFVYANQTLMRDSANLFRYDFATRKTTQITQLQNEFVGNFSASPNGKAIVFERAKTLDEDRTTDLWIVPINGGTPRLLVSNGFSPSWR